MPSPISEVLAGGTVERDDEGRIILGSNTNGCPYCGAISVQPDREENLAVLWHASLECCDKRITDEISWRRTEITRVKRRVEEDLAAVTQAEKEAEEAEYPSQEKAALKRAENARKYADIRFREVHNPQILELEYEVRRLQKKLDRVPPPVPYKEAP